MLNLEELPIKLLQVFEMGSTKLYDARNGLLQIESIPSRKGTTSVSQLARVLE